jgi:hypothetical protein
MQKYNPLPIKGAITRYDANAGKWAVVDKQTKKPTQHFDMAIMKNVKFSAEQKSEGGGCGGPTVVNVGYATGDLYLHKASDQFTSTGNGGNVQFNSLSFVGGKFVKQSGEVVTEADELVLMPGRHAYFFNK